MSNNYNFDEIKAESPTIQMGGVQYRLLYPTIEDLEKIQELKTEKEQNEAIYKFIENVNKDDPAFMQVFKKQNLKVVKAFTDMVKKEFGIEE